jgi:hypothetical protein
MDIKAGNPAKEPRDPDDESSYDSDDWPKGPYRHGGGEADCPQHCGACGLFLENALTDDGDSYVRELAEPYSYPTDDGDVASWDEISERARDDGQAVLADWIDYYFRWG